MIELAGVTKAFGGAAIGPIDLSITAQSRMALVGPSGSGKSTLLRLIVGLLGPDAGEVRIFDKPLTAQSAMELRLRMGYVIQDGGLFPHLDARANVTLVARQLGWSAARIETRLESLRELMQLHGQVLKRYPVQLSGGERQRIAMIRALFLDPPLLLMDEPMGALDPLIRDALERDLLKVFEQLTKTVVLVTHDLNQAALLAHDLVILRAGVIEQRGTWRELVSAPKNAFVRDFIAAQTRRVQAGD